jgi:hypothetical protein
MKITLRTWVLRLGALGLLLPVAFIVRWQISGSGFGVLQFTLWPASIILMGLEGNHSISSILIVYAIALTANVLLYAIVGFLAWPALRFFLRRPYTKTGLAAKDTVPQRVNE